MAEKKKSTAYAVPVTAASDKKKALETAIAQIEKNYGKGAIMRLGDDIPVNVEAISTGSLSLDLALGIGGVPRGRIVEIYGPESCGKTTLALHVVASAQKEGGEAAYIDVEHALEPAYVAAVILAESSYNPEAVSSADARGLMQLLPSTAEWIAGKLGESYSEDSLFQPETNIRYGTWYLSYLSRRFDGDATKIVCAYHAGQGNVDAWLKNPQYSSDGVTLDVIPTEDTATYAGRVLRARDVYRKYYFPVPDEAQEGDSPDA